MVAQKKKTKINLNKYHFYLPIVQLFYIVSLSNMCIVIVFTGM